MRSYLRGSRSLSACLLEITLDLLSARTRRVEILLCIALDLRLPMLTTFNRITEIVQTDGQLGTVDACHVLLRLEKTSLLQGSCLFTLSFGHVENYSVGMQLGRSIAIHGTSRVMFERSSDKSAGSLGSMNITDSRLRVALEFRQSNANALPMSLAH